MAAQPGQTFFKSYPRNHLYRTPIVAKFPGFWPTGKPDHVGDLPHAFDRKAVLRSNDGDTPEKTAQDLGRLRSGLRIRERLLEATDLLSINFCQVSMKSRSFARRTLNLRFALEFMRLKFHCIRPEVRFAPESGHPSA
jgi:hypothetical protein